MDPYLKLNIGDDLKYKTKTHKDGGRNPKWEEQADFDYDGKESALRLVAKDEDIGKDDLIGTVMIPLDELTQEDRLGKEYCYSLLSEKGKKHGDIALIVKYTPYIP